VNPANTPVTLNWTPGEAQGRKEYSFELDIWDKYGAHGVPAEFHGLVYGTIYGKPVAKNIYRFEFAEDPETGKNERTLGVDSRPADFASSAWASIHLSPFFDHKSMTREDYYMSYASDMNERNLFSAGGKRSEGREIYMDRERWKVYMVPPGNYLVAMGITDARGLRPEVPTIGPAVTSTNKLVSANGAGAWATAENREFRNHTWDFAGGNLATYAYIGSDEPDLSTDAGSGLLATLLDPSISHVLSAKTYYDFGLGANTYQKDIGNGTSDPTILSYWGLDAGLWSATGLATKAPFINSPLQPLQLNNLVYDGDLQRLLPGDLNGGTDYLQLSFPSIGQTTFFTLQNTGAPDKAFPVAAYAPTLGWNSVIGYPVQGTVDLRSDKGVSSGAVKLNLSNDATTDAGDYGSVAGSGSKMEDAPLSTFALPYAASKSDLLTLSVLKRDTKSVIPNWGYGTDNPTTAPTLPYWIMTQTGVVQPEERYMEISGRNNTLADDRVVGLDDADDVNAIANASLTGSKFGGLLPTQISEWGQIDPYTTFTPTIRRTNFAYHLRNALPRNIGNMTTTNLVTDTFRVVAYPSGTAIGPVENNMGVPVLVEFGNINDTISGGATSGLFGTPNLGATTLPVPKEGYWDAGLATPVAVYNVRYEDRPNSANARISLLLDGTTDPEDYIDAMGNYSGLSASMGHIQEISGGGAVTVDALRPPVNVKITTHDVWNTTDAKTFNPRNDRTSSFVSTIGDFDDVFNGKDTFKYPTATGVSAVAYRATSGGGGTAEAVRPKVWLSWENPKTEFSGTILEFFVLPKVADDTDEETALASFLHDGVLPNYKVHVSEKVSRFPIPDAWIDSTTPSGSHGRLGPLASSDGIDDDLHVVVRLRSVKYGDSKLDNLVSFDESPFKQALPAQWAETITTKIDFGAANPNPWGPTAFTRDTLISISPANATVSLPQAVAGTPWIFGNNAASTPASNPANITTTNPRNIHNDITEHYWHVAGDAGSWEINAAAKSDVSTLSLAQLQALVGGDLIGAKLNPSNATGTGLAGQGTTNPTIQLLKTGLMTAAGMPLWWDGDTINFDVYARGESFFRGTTQGDALTDEPATVKVTFQDISSSSTITLPTIQGRVYDVSSGPLGTDQVISWRLGTSGTYTSGLTAFETAVLTIANGINSKLASTAPVGLTHAALESGTGLLNNMYEYQWVKTANHAKNDYYDLIQPTANEWANFGTGATFIAPPTIRVTSAQMGSDTSFQIRLAVRRKATDAGTPPAHAAGSAALSGNITINVIY
ncbi:MAG: hypothetical protein FWG12_07710, partial [Holophagaceae bacterium]|nr:hypothetical protein [Holophagaceae bacterium]